MILKKEAYNIIGACMEVHSILGQGFLESVYQEALAIEFEKRKIPFVKEKKLEIEYKDVKLEKYYIADFICYDNIIVELKALTDLTSNETSQVLNYLTITGYSLALLVNFGQKSLEYKRLVK